jgi:hypothetical protein
MTTKLTKQGVRDLDAGRPRPKKAEPRELPVMQFCKHPRMKTVEGFGDYCPDCKRLWDWDGKEW